MKAGNRLVVFLLVTGRLDVGLLRLLLFCRFGDAFGKRRCARDARRLLNSVSKRLEVGVDVGHGFEKRLVLGKGKRYALSEVANRVSEVDC